MQNLRIILLTKNKIIIEIKNIKLYLPTVK